MATDCGLLVWELTVVVQIRPVTSADIAQVRAQLIETWHATYDSIYGVTKVRELTTRWHSLDALGEQARRPETAFLLADDHGRVVGSAYALRQSGSVAHLSRLYVAPSAQGRGIGKALMDATFAALPGVTCHRLEVEPKNAAAIAFYQRHGFIEAGRTSDCGGASGVPALILKRRCDMPAAPR
jgi:ribosomal protein S18 acetylase RimI-like enzyme